MEISLWIAFAAGIVSFLSPCTLPLFPSYIGYITGISLDNQSPDGQKTVSSLRRRVLLHSILFCLGLSCIFIMLGVGFTAIGHSIRLYKTWVGIVGGVVIIVMGLFMADVIKIPSLWREYRLHLPHFNRVSYFASFFVGVIFAAGWTPCIGPILSSVLAMVMIHPEIGYRYMIVYAVGFSIPFLLLSMMFTWVRPLIRFTQTIRHVGGWVLMAAGVLLLTGKMALLAAWLQQMVGFNGG